MHTSRDNNDDEQHNDTNNQTHAHLHILPPHLFSYSVCASSKSLGGDSQVVGLVLQRVKSLASLRYLVDIFTHDSDGIVDLL